jgi:nucleotide-binding universal stress UspA family protein
MSDIHTILHPTDFSENSRPAFETACALARNYDATLLVVHVMIPSASPVLDVPLPDPLRPIEGQGIPAQFAWPRPSDPRVRVSHRLAEGEPADEILRLVEAVPCDLVVMGTHGKTGLARLLAGSVAEEVLRQARCPVMVVKAPIGRTPAIPTQPSVLPGDRINVRPLGTALATAVSHALLKTRGLELVREIVRAGQQVKSSLTKGETTVHCLEGRVDLTAVGKTQALSAGELVLLPPNEPYTFEGIEDASLLLTIVLAKP